VKLSNVMKDEFSVSKLSWAAVLVLQVAAIVVAIVAIREPAWALPALTSGALVPIACAALKRRGGISYDRGEKLRRLIVRSEGLGEAPSPVELAVAAAEMPGLASLDPEPLGSYYASAKAPGPQRLAHIVAESAMFTARLARTSQAICLLAVGVGLLVGVIRLFIFVAAPSGAPIDAERTAQAASMVLAFGFTTEFAGLMFGYSDLADGARRALDSCGRLAEKVDVRLDEVVAAVTDYDLALAKGPPLSGIVYRLQRRFLDRAWKILNLP
jgi:hypothetical protein